jgi:two-component system phosphate regulon sensor histidine kinase PhoR
MKKLRGTAILMMIAILCITGFQGYWLHNNYVREKDNLDIKTADLFRETVEQLQMAKLNIQESIGSTAVQLIRTPSITTSRKKAIRRPPISLINLVQKKTRDSILNDTINGTVLITMKDDSFPGIRTTKRMFGTIDKIEIKRSDSGDFRRPGSMVLRKRLDSTELGPEIIEAIPTEKNVRVEYRANVLRPTGATSVTHPIPARREGDSFFRFAYFMDSVFIRDSVTIKEISTGYGHKLNQSGIKVDFNIQRLDTLLPESNETVTIGFSKPISFRYSLSSYAGYMFDQLKLPILFSVLLVGITIASFVLLYKTMMRQQRLAELKNEFISNITHELKTPIATVGVAIEALKNFNAIDDPRRTTEYLDISQNELQRLNLLVDKVLKLSMFEKKEIELKYEETSLKDIVTEVMTSMRLQIEKYRATVSLDIKGSSVIQADRLHLLSVVFNLLDNALKYGRDETMINIVLEEHEDSVKMSIADNGIGIPEEYKEKVFEKFFRIPHGDTHNAKGYGLGLSYVAHVIKKHKGSIHVQPGIGQGATFVIILPKHNSQA